ncbi:TolB-like translocation protein [Actinomadura soli]|uniref:TolB-like translocation protein n=1 Tax=Actinomadura soli TaxID=2508997 RepID=A0A5C4J822_9ACTN|nr:TolB-like translocation protein [Actinomadura soli]TMQ95318.1 TolB-like translocation protein [Actinomadura soli]
MNRSRVILTLAVLLVGVAAGTVLTAALGRDGASVAGEAGPGLFRDEHIVFRSLRPGADQGRIAYAPPDAVENPVLAGPRCLRVAAGAKRALCLRDGGVPGRPYELVRLDDRLREAGDEPLAGVPSRARVAPGGRHFATTVFVNGHGYISLGFSTETVIYDGETGRPLANLERFTFLVNGSKDTSADRNVWGVTFAADSNTFFATVAVSGHTYLVRGDLARRTLTALRENAECPSLSPDQTRVVFKKRVNETSQDAWRFHVFDLRTGREWPLGETRSVDDQVAWLDGKRVMYAVPKTAGGRTTADIWTAPVDGGKPRLLIPDADSPTLVGGDL